MSPKVLRVTYPSMLTDSRSSVIDIERGRVSVKPPSKLMRTNGEPERVVVRKKDLNHVERGRAFSLPGGDACCIPPERGRVIVLTNDRISVERRHLPISLPAGRKASRPLAKGAIKRSESPKTASSSDSGQTERRRHEFQERESDTHTPSIVRTTKIARGVAVFHKTAAAEPDQLEASNKHVQQPSPSPQSSDPDVHHQDATKKDNTNFVVSPDELPFLTQKSSTRPVAGSAFADRWSNTFDVSDSNDVEGLILAPDGHPNSPTFGHFKIPHPDERVTVQ